MVQFVSGDMMASAEYPLIAGPVVSAVRIARSAPETQVIVRYDDGKSWAWAPAISDHTVKRIYV